MPCQLLELFCTISTFPTETLNISSIDTILGLQLESDQLFVYKLRPKNTKIELPLRPYKEEHSYET